MTQYAKASAFGGGGAGGSGDVVGPASATDNAIARYDTTTGKLIQNSGATIDDSGNLTANNISGTNTGDQTITLTGGVTGSGTGSFAATVVTNANLTGDVTSVGNATTLGTVPVAKGGTGETTATAGFDALSPMTTGGDVLYGGASGTATRLANGTAGQVLTSAGTTAAPTWETPSAGFSDPMTTRGDIIIRNAANATARLAVGTNTQVLVSDGTDIAWGTNTAAVLTFDVESKAADFTAASGKMYLVSSAAARAITMPAASAGAWFRVKDSTGDCNTNNFTLTRAGSESIEGIAANKVLQTNWGSWTVVSDGTDWFLING